MLHYESAVLCSYCYQKKITHQEVVAQVHYGAIYGAIYGVPGSIKAMSNWQHIQAVNTFYG
jgi:hypothetical protein